MSASVAAASMAASLAELVGDRHVNTDASRLTAFSIDGVVPRIEVSPQSVEEVASVLRFCEGNGLVVVPAGGFTAQLTGRPPQRIDVLLRTNRLNAIEHYDPGDLTIGAGAGVTLAGIHSTLAEHGQMLPISSPNPESATLGGVLARSAHDPRKQGYGGLRDFCIGIRFVTADGKFARAGGRVVKNVAGFDLMKLLIGSHGTLAVIVSASFKVFPSPRQTCTFMAPFQTMAAALQFRDRIIASPLTPMCLELLSSEAQRFAGLSPVANSPWFMLVRAAGSAAVLQRYRTDLGSAIAWEIDGDPEARLWDGIGNFTNAAAANDSMVLGISVPVSDVERVVDICKRTALGHASVLSVIASAGGGNLRCAFTSPSEASPGWPVLVQNLRSTLGPGASAVVLRCGTGTKRELDVWGASPTDIACMRAVKSALDGNDILNRGRFLL
ncbi:MAG TPA: FAD-binding oxidoreductase [Terriglobales bacterium]|nr:FAD-binding oxidoreductase [Terriglobales bacterium]